MYFPKNNLLPNNENPLFKDWNQKKIGFSPLVFCEFFQGMEVLQIYGVETGEYIFGTYWNGEFCGPVYFGYKFTWKQVAEICEMFMPKKWDDVFEFVKTHGDKIWYYKYHQSQYAFVLQNVLEKIEQ